MSDLKFPQNTLHRVNIYTSRDNALAVPMADQQKIVEIAKAQTAKWYPDTVLNDVDEMSAEADTKKNSLDIDSMHKIYMNKREFHIDITDRSKIYENPTTDVTEEAKVKDDDDEQQQQQQQQKDKNDDTMDDQEQTTITTTSTTTTTTTTTTQNLSPEDAREEQRRKDTLITPERIDLMNTHPLYKNLQPQDVEYLQALTQRFAHHPLAQNYAHFNPYAAKHAAPTWMDETKEALCRKSPFPFELSLFQLHGLAALIHNHHLLVTAHTGSGKTMVAHGVIFNALAKGGRVVYTTPIKALSNQKYAELSNLYPDVGLLTGDVAINPDASIVVMTTEILRNQSIHVSTKFDAAIFDEVHYMEDMARGVIWEETLLTLPLNTQMVFLSATVSNGDEFARWISQVTRRPCHWISTKVRAVPIAHLVVEKPVLSQELQRKLAEDGRKRRMTGSTTNDVNSNNNTQQDAKETEYIDFPLTTWSHFLDLPPVDSSKEVTTDIQTMPQFLAIQQIVSTLLTAIENRWLPLIAFSFVRKDCDFFAKEVSRMGFCVTTEKEQVEIREYCAQNLPKDTPEREIMVEMFVRGIAMHHSGQIPRAREVVEVLLAKSWVKILFATETFAVGVNVPVRAVLFTNLTKYDGTANRLLTAAEYTQMSGRAGRRGMDTVGVSLTLQDVGITPEVYRDVVCGAALCLESRFRVSIGLLLSSFTSSGSDPTSALSNATDGTTHDDALVDEEYHRKGGQYSLQNVIESSFAIFRFSNNNTNTALSMFTRGLFIFARFIHKLMISCQHLPSAQKKAFLNKFTPWLGDVEKVYQQLTLKDVAMSTLNVLDKKAQKNKNNANNNNNNNNNNNADNAMTSLMEIIKGLPLNTMKIVDYLCDEKYNLLIQPALNIKHLALILLTPAIYYPLYIQALYFLSIYSLQPINLQPLQQQNEAQKVLNTFYNNYNLFNDNNVFFTILSLLQPATNGSGANETLFFQKLPQQQMLLTQEQQYQQNTTTTQLQDEDIIYNLSDIADITITKTPINTITTTPTYLNALEQYKQQQKEQQNQQHQLVDTFSAHNYFNQQPNPNDVLNYCVPGRVVYIEFPNELHDLTNNEKQSIFTNYLFGNNNNNNNNPSTTPYHIGHTLGWGVVLGMKTQSPNTATIDVLVALPNNTNNNNAQNQHMYVQPQQRYSLEVISICECAISKISNIVLHVPQTAPLDENNNANGGGDLFEDCAGLGGSLTTDLKEAMWVSLQYIIKSFMVTKQQESIAYITSLIKTNNNNPQQTSSSLLVTANTDTTMFNQMLNEMSTRELFLLNNYISLPLIFTKTNPQQSQHQASLHRFECRLFDALGGKKKRALDDAVLENVLSQSPTTTTTNNNNNNNNNDILTHLNAQYNTLIKTKLQQMRQQAGIIEEQKSQGGVDKEKKDDLLLGGEQENATTTTSVEDMAHVQEEEHENDVLKDLSQNHIAMYLYIKLLTTLQTFPPALRIVVMMFLDAQACWLSTKIDNYNHTLSLATTSHNNHNGNTQEEVIAQQKILLEQQLLKNQQNIKKNKNNSIQSIISHYLQTVSVMSKYMKSAKFIQELEESNYSKLQREKQNAAAAAASATKTTTTDEILTSYELTPKGHVCSYIDNPNSLILTDLLTEDYFTELSPQYCAAILSIFVTTSTATDTKSILGDVKKAHPIIANVYVDKILPLAAKLEEFGAGEQDNQQDEEDAAQNNGADGGDQDMMDGDDDKDDNKNKKKKGKFNNKKNNNNNKDKQQKKPSTKDNKTKSLLYDPTELGLSMIQPVLVWCETRDINKALEANNVIYGSADAAAIGTTPAANPPSSNRNQIFPGSLARTLNRTVDLIEQLKKGAMKLGVERLTQLLEDTENLIKQGVLFQSSLHLEKLSEQLREAKKIA